ncbi:MAG: acyl-CoA thioesterase [Pseudomonadota bacterium]
MAKAERLGRLWQKGWPRNRALLARVSHRVPFQDADPTGAVWHGNYFRYYDLARVALLDRFEFGYRAMAKRGQLWPIVDTEVRYLKPVRYGDSIAVEARMVEWEFRLRLHYRVLLDDHLINEAITVQVPVDATTDRLIVGAPDDLIERIERACLSASGSHDQDA